MKTAFFLFVLLLCWHLENSHAQVKVIEVDSTSGYPTESLPFDQHFILKIPIKTSRVTDVAYIPHVWSMNLPESMKYRKLTAESENKKVDYKIRELKNSYRVKEINKVNYLLIDISDTNVLDPGKSYTFLWAGDTDDSVMDLFDQYHKYRKDSIQYARNSQDTVARNAYPKHLLNARKIYIKLAKENKEKFGFEVGWPLEDTISLTPIVGGYNDVSFDNKDTLYKRYEELDRLNAAYQSRLTGLQPDSSPDTKAAFLSLMQMIIQESDHFDSKQKNNYLTDIRKSAQRLSRLAELSNNEYQQLLKGLVSIDCNLCKTNGENEFESRQANLKVTLAAIEELYIIAEALQTGKPYLAPAVVTIKSYRDTIRSLLKDSRLADLEKIVQVRKKIKDIVFIMALSRLTMLGGVTHVYSFETRSKLSIAPDFGIVTTRIGNDASNPYSFVPYLGFHINLRPINRDIPFWSYRHRPLHFASLFLGWSIVPIDNGPKLSAGADSVRSFFSKDKGTLLTGLGIRLGNFARLTSGAMWYFKYTRSGSGPDPTIYDQRKLKSWLFIGLSVDLALKDLLNGISDVFTGAPRVFRPPTPTVVAN